MYRVDFQIQGGPDDGKWRVIRKNVSRDQAERIKARCEQEQPGCIIRILDKSADEHFDPEFSQC